MCKYSISEEDWAELRSKTLLLICLEPFLLLSALRMLVQLSGKSSHSGLKLLARSKATNRQSWKF